MPVGSVEEYKALWNSRCSSIDGWLQSCELDPSTTLQLAFPLQTPPRRKARRDGFQAHHRRRAGSLLTSGATSSYLMDNGEKRYDGRRVEGVQRSQRRTDDELRFSPRKARSPQKTAQSNRAKHEVKIPLKGVEDELEEITSTVASTLQMTTSSIKLSEGPLFSSSSFSRPRSRSRSRPRSPSKDMADLRLAKPPILEKASAREWPETIRALNGRFQRVFRGLEVMPRSLKVCIPPSLLLNPRQSPGSHGN